MPVALAAFFDSRTQTLVEADNHCLRNAGQTSCLYRLVDPVVMRIVLGVSPDVCTEACHMAGDVLDTWADDDDAQLRSRIPDIEVVLSSVAAGEAVVWLAGKSVTATDTAPFPRSQGSGEAAARDELFEVVVALGPRVERLGIALEILDSGI